MKVDANLFITDLSRVPQAAKDFEDLGFDGVRSAEAPVDPFFPLLLAAEHTERIELMTSIAVAFARNPMILANIGNDLQAFSRGRFVLGLGSQIKPHIEKRFSMPWSKPAARMREFVLAMRAIWACWYDGEKLEFKGEFYRHTLMTPMFTPTNNEYGPPRVVLSAVGPLMTEVAGEVADGLLLHPFTTQRFLKEVTIPAIERGRKASTRGDASFELCHQPLVVSGQDERQWEKLRSAAAKQLAFYGSTPAYRPVLDVHGWGGVQDELNARSKRGEWNEMASLITDEMLEELAIVAEPDKVVSSLTKRYGDVVNRSMVDFKFASPDRVKDYLEELRSS